MALLRYAISPLAHGLSTAAPQLYTDQFYSPAPVNGRVEQASFKKRWGYYIDRALGRAVYDIILFQMNDGTRFTLYLTDTDLCKREAAGTFSYITETYTTGTVTGFSGANKIVAGNSTAWNTSGVAAGDYFVVDADHTSTAEPDVHWTKIASVDGASQITLDSAYPHPASTGTYKIRKIYSVPTNDRWAWSIVGNKFCFGNGNTNVQYWGGSGYAADLDATNATKARFMCEYGNRLCLGDMYLTAARCPLTFKWSKEGDPATWVDSTAGENDFLETGDYIKGIFKVGASVVVFKDQSYIVGSRTGTATDPFTFPTERKGLGLSASWSVAECLDTIVWLGRDDFYILNGDQATTIGGPVRNDILDYVTTKERERTWVSTNHILNEIGWTINTTVGKRMYVWNYQKNEWYIYVFPDDIVAAGRGAI